MHSKDQNCSDKVVHGPYIIELLINRNTLEIEEAASAGDARKMAKSFVEDALAYYYDLEDDSKMKLKGDVVEAVVYKLTKETSYRRVIQ